MKKILYFVQQNRRNCRRRLQKHLPADGYTTDVIDELVVEMESIRHGQICLHWYLCEVMCVKREKELRGSIHAGHTDATLRKDC